MKNNKMSRRTFMSQSTKGATGLMAAGSVLHLASSKVLGANDRVNMAVIGIRSRGNEHINECPQKIKCSGGYYAFDSDQETPNTQSATFEYKDGKILDFDVRGLYTNTEGSIGIGNLIYGSKGWMEIDAYSAAWKTFFGRDDEPGPSHNGTDDAADAANLAGTGGSGHFVNFIETVRSGDWTKLNCDVEQGHKSTALCHLANISYRLNRELKMDEYSGKFIDDEIANEYLTKEYRQPFVLSSQI
ncbi:hypothetical protein GF406_22905 [candidate division KSB1 bacterium]|nr:hypothetical protein [candidate division KSB1 bacterium]